MKHEIPFRIIVADPLPGVLMRVQKGKDEFLEPTRETDRSTYFDFHVTVDASAGTVNFLGKFAQGPRDGRFVYVNSGTYAGQTQTCWSRRAKVTLMSIQEKQIREVVDDDSLVIETTIPGIGPDGGPTCATVKSIEWKVAAR
jgi:hypothetical protein